MTRYGCPYCDFEATTKDEVRAHITREEDADHRDRNGLKGAAGIEVLEGDEEAFDTGEGHDGSVETEGIDEIFEGDLLGNSDGSSSDDDSTSSVPSGMEEDRLSPESDKEGETISVSRAKLRRIRAEMWALENADEINTEAALEMLDERLYGLAES